MLRRIVLAAFISGALAGLALAALQALWVVPLILEAETYEHPAAGAPAGNEPVSAAHLNSDRSAASSSRDAAATGPAHDRYAPPRRMLLTALADVIVGFAFALILVGCMVLRGRPVGMRAGLAWGLAGYMAFVGVPALGLPPELPGMAATALGPRQLWWLGAVASTGGGLALTVFGRGWPLRAAGLVLLAVPHLAGAPHLPPQATSAGEPPAELASRYVVATLVTLGVFWLLLGGLAGWSWSRLRPRA
ncbi:MAG: CbtA family protein [Candidatus Lambdaproteobacteria bacterium]|nr:CbtA family protein [Candidatus Lambdaproteobacteria bacterium]